MYEVEKILVSFSFSRRTEFILLTAMIEIESKSILITSAVFDCIILTAMIISNRFLLSLSKIQVATRESERARKRAREQESERARERQTERENQQRRGSPLAVC
jgi:hypothetical protein